MNGKKKGGKGKAALMAVAPAGAVKKSAAKAIDSAIDLETVRELARIINEFGLSEVEADPSGRAGVRRVLGGGGHRRPLAAHGAPSSIALAPSPPAESAAEAGTFITSPFVGTFYRAPSPEAPSFVDVGTPVRKGQVVCIVEAMKLMNEIESESEGKVAEILVKNGEHVEYGQKLIRIVLGCVTCTKEGFNSEPWARSRCAWSARVASSASSRSPRPLGGRTRDALHCPLRRAEKVCIGHGVGAARATSTCRPSSAPPRSRAPTPFTRATASWRRTPPSPRSFEQCGLKWIGPQPEVMRLMGDKVSARKAMTEAGVPILPGTGVIEIDRQARGGRRAHRLPDHHQGLGGRRQGEG